VRTRRVGIAVLVGILGLAAAASTAGAGGREGAVVRAAIANGSELPDLDLPPHAVRELRAPAQASQASLTLTGTPVNDGVSILHGAFGELIVITHPTVTGPGAPCVTDNPNQFHCPPGFITVILGNTGPGKDRLRVRKHVRIPIGMGGFNGRDNFKGGSGPDLLLGESGADRLKGKRGGDILCGGKGRDRLRGGPGRDRVKPGGGGPCGPQ
jgi:hypothetical protein